MPLYEYECRKCHKTTEKIEKVSGPHLKKCPHCGGKVEKLVSRSAIQFRGSGWYVTDYAGKKSSVDTASASGSSDKSEVKDSAAKESKDSKDSKETKESKPAPEKKTEKKKA